MRRKMRIRDGQGNLGHYDVFFETGAKPIRVEVKGGRHVSNEAFLKAYQEINLQANRNRYVHLSESDPALALRPDPSPPGFGQRLACFLLPADRQEDVLGDLEERYRNRWLRTLGPSGAWWCFVWHVLISSPILARLIGGFRRVVGH
jgi:hypothetical protein